MDTNETLLSLYTTLPIQSAAFFLYSGGALSDFTVTGDVTVRDVWTEINSTSTLVYNSSFSTPNLVLKVLFLPNHDASHSAKLTIMGHRQDENNYVGARFDYEANEVQLIEVVAGIENVLSTVTFPFKNRESLLAQLWTFEDGLYLWCNDAVIAAAISNNFLSQTGFAVSVDTNSMCIIGSIGVGSLRVQPDPAMPEDLTFLPLILRKAVQEYAYPNSPDWAKYMKALKYYQWYKDEWYLNSQWRELGYPAYPPSTEDFFS